MKYSIGRFFSRRLLIQSYVFHRSTRLHSRQIMPAGCVVHSYLIVTQDVNKVTPAEPRRTILPPSLPVLPAHTPRADERYMYIILCVNDGRARLLIRINNNIKTKRRAAVTVARRRGLVYEWKSTLIIIDVTRVHHRWRGGGGGLGKNLCVCILLLSSSSYFSNTLTMCGQIRL